MKLFDFLSEATGSSNIYTVRSGDSLPNIAKSHDTTIGGIMWQNPQFASANDIRPGSQIRLPGSGMSGSSMSRPNMSKPSNRVGGGAAGNAKIALDYFIQQGWSSEQAAGIVANLQAESTPNLNTDAVGDGGKAYGIAQWHRPRQQDFSRVMGKPLQGSSLQDQLEFVQWELNNTEANAGRRLKSAKTAEDAAAIVDQYYERSSGAHRQKRMAMAAALAPSTQTA
jgi:LysM repeat protein